MYTYYVPGTVLSRYIAVKETDNNFCPCGAYILVNLKSLDFTNQIYVSFALIGKNDY